MDACSQHLFPSGPGAEQERGRAAGDRGCEPQYMPG